MRFVYLIVIFNLLSIAAFCQPGDPGGNPTVPITGIEYLLGGGLLLGVRALMAKIKSRKQ